jgi:hypothetical protein
MAAQLQVEGLDTLVRTMRRAGVDISELKDAHTRAASIVASEAAARAPRRSGRLAGSIRPAKQVKRARVMAGGASVPYAGPIHWGWPARNIPANPFMTEAAQGTEPEWTRAYLEDVQKALDNVRGA